MKKFTSVFLAMVLTATVPAGFQAVYAEDTSAEVQIRRTRNRRQMKIRMLQSSFWLI